MCVDATRTSDRIVFKGVKIMTSQASEWNHAQWDESLHSLDNYVHSPVPVSLFPMLSYCLLFFFIARIKCFLVVIHLIDDWLSFTNKSHYIRIFWTGDVQKVDSALSANWLNANHVLVENNSNQQRCSHICLDKKKTRVRVDKNSNPGNITCMWNHHLLSCYWSAIIRSLEDNWAKCLRYGCCFTVFSLPFNQFLNIIQLQCIYYLLTLSYSGWSECWVVSNTDTRTRTGFWTGFIMQYSCTSWLFSKEKCFLTSCLYCTVKEWLYNEVDCFPQPLNSICYEQEYEANHKNHSSLTHPKQHQSTRCGYAAASVAIIQTQPDKKKKKRVSNFAVTQL